MRLKPIGKYMNVGPGETVDFVFEFETRTCGARILIGTAPGGGVLPHCSPDIIMTSLVGDSFEHLARPFPACVWNGGGRVISAKKYVVSLRNKGPELHDVGVIMFVYLD